MFIIEADEVIKRLTPDICIELMRKALSDLEKGICVQPLRSLHRLPQNHLFGFMPAYLGDNSYFGAKIIDACANNKGTTYPTHMGYVMMFESVHGSPVGLVDATSITAIRTGAVSAVATDLLSRKDSRHLALIGAGAQARSHLDAISLVRSLEKVFIYDIDKDSAVRFQTEMSRKHHIDIKVCDSVKEAVSDADIICTLTPSKDPYLQLEWLKPGSHINAVGAFTPTTREVTSQLVANARLYADSVDSMKAECGEYLTPKSEGLFDETHIVGSIGALLLGTVEGRRNEQEITLFDALGLAVEDVMCARYFCE